MDTENPVEVKQRRSRLGKKIVLVVIAAVLVHSLALASVAMPLYVKVPVYLMERGNYATALRVALDSEKSSITCEFMTISYLNEYGSRVLCHPSSLVLLSAWYAVVGEDAATGTSYFAFRYSALNEEGTEKETGYGFGMSEKGGDIRIASVDVEEYGTFSQVRSIARWVKELSPDQLDRINRHIVNGTLGEIASTISDFSDAMHADYE